MTPAPDLTADPRICALRCPLRPRPFLPRYRRGLVAAIALLSLVAGLAGLVLIQIREVSQLRWAVVDQTQTATRGIGVVQAALLNGLGQLAKMVQAEPISVGGPAVTMRQAIVREVTMFSDVLGAEAALAKVEQDGRIAWTHRVPATQRRALDEHARTLLARAGTPDEHRPLVVPELSSDTKLAVAFPPRWERGTVAVAFFDVDGWLDFLRRAVGDGDIRVAFEMQAETPPRLLTASGQRSWSSAPEFRRDCGDDAPIAAGLRQVVVACEFAELRGLRVLVQRDLPTLRDHIAAYDRAALLMQFALAVAAGSGLWALLMYAWTARMRAYDAYQLAELRARTAFYDRLTGGMTDVLVEVTDTGHITYVGGGTDTGPARRIWMRGQRLDQAFAPCDRARLQDLLARTVRGGRAVAAPFRIDSGGAGTTWLEPRANLLAAPGTEQRILVAWRDVTAAVTTRAELEQRNLQAELIFNHMPVAVCELRRRPDGATEVAFLSPNAERFSGFARAELRKHWIMREHIVPEDRAARDAAHEEAWLHDGSHNVEYRFVDGHGQQRWFREFIKRGRAIDGDPTLILVAVDVSEQKNAEWQVAHTARMAELGQMATAMAHELNQPLAIIKMAAENMDGELAKPEPAPARLRSRLARIRAQVDRATAVIDHMRIFGRVSDEGPRPVAIAQVLDGAELMFGAQLRHRQIKLSRRLEPPDVAVLADPILLEHAVVNILANARDAFELGKALGPPEIHIAASAENGKVRLRIADNAGGIPADVLPRIFEPFVTTKPAGKGTGLGLSTAYGLIRDMGGAICAANADGGAIFRIVLPRAGATATTDPERTRA